MNDAKLFVGRPMSHLTFPGTIVCPTTLSAIQHFTTYSLLVLVRETAIWIMAATDLCDGLHYFVFGIQAFTWNSLPEEAY